MVGAISAGTVGRLASGRLVIVDKVDQFSAFLISLPDQPAGAMDNTWDGRFVGPFKASPFVSIEVIDKSELSARNQHFLDSGEVLPAPASEIVVKVRRVSRSKGPDIPRPTAESIKAQPAAAPVQYANTITERPGYAVFVHAWRSPANQMSRYVSKDMKGYLYLENAYMDGNHPPHVYVKLT